jgi:nanoRNase/pAp phosphatase (c-di-AMP/oligoRNAs hydrolase)
VYRIIADKYKDKNIKIVYFDRLDEHFKSFQNFEKIEWIEDIGSYNTEHDLMIMLDCGEYSRVSLNFDKLLKIQNKICIDHHASKPSEFTLSTIIPNIPSCSELIFRLFEEKMSLDKSLAETFLLGILTDTGNFVYLDSSQTETFLVAKKLIDISKVNITEFRQNFSTISKGEFDIVGEFIKNTNFVNVDGWPPFQYTYVSKEFLENGKYTKDEISTAGASYIVSYLTSIKDYNWGFVLKPKSGYCSVSFRSLPRSVNVRDVSEKMGIGGGHDRAAGGLFKESSDPLLCAEQIISWLKNNKPIMN